MQKGTYEFPTYRATGTGVLTHLSPLDKILLTILFK
jgi:hypothetical protein